MKDKTTRVGKNDPGRTYKPRDMRKAGDKAKAYLQKIKEEKEEAQRNKIIESAKEYAQ